MRAEASETSEMTSQVLFGEHFTIVEKEKNNKKEDTQSKNTTDKSLLPNYMEFKQ